MSAPATAARPSVLDRVLRDYHSVAEGLPGDALAQPAPARPVPTHPRASPRRRCGSRAARDRGRWASLRWLAHSSWHSRRGLLTEPVVATPLELERQRAIAAAYDAAARQ